MVTGTSRGHKIIYTDTWRWEDGVSIEVERPCARCGRMPTSEGYDACLGHIDGATSACCGHGLEDPHVVYETPPKLTLQIAPIHKVVG